jgi:phage tail-like protein
MQSRHSNFRYLNREGKWLDFHWSGLELTPQGALQLLSRPRLENRLPAPSTNVATPVAPSGIAVDDSGRVFYSIPGENRVMAAAGCDPVETPLICLTERAGLGSLNAPRGLLVLREPERLVVVDSGNHRVLFCDLCDFSVREVWGQADLGSEPSPSDAPDRFNTPWTVAADEDGQNVYVLDSGNRRIVKFTRTGDLDSEFIARMGNSGLVPHPGALAVSGRGEATRVFVADLAANGIFVFDRSGAPILDAFGAPGVIRWPGMGAVFALAVSEKALYVGDNNQQRILSFGLAHGFPFAGEAAGFNGYVTALTVDSRSGVLLVQMGGATQPLSLNLAGAYLGSAVLWSDPVSAGPSGVAWNRLTASITNAIGSHVEFYYATSNQPVEPLVDPAADDPFSDPGWRPLPNDVEDFLLAGGKALYLFVGVRFSSDRTGTPQLAQMRVDFDTESFTRYLPAIYREPGGQADFLKRFVSLFQGMFEDIEDEVGSLERYFDPFAAPAAALPWLTSWLAVDVDQGEPEARIRNSIAGAFRRYRWRGTIEGLRVALLEDAGVHAIVSEPIAASSFWAMPPAADCFGSTVKGTAPLGLETHLPSMEPGGAVLGSTAALDHSYLITDAEFGEPLFEGAAWQFIVEVYRGEVSTDARLQLVKDIIEREKPAHTMYSLALIDPAMRVGFQARVGIDTIVGGTSGPMPLGEAGSGFGLRLGGPLPPRVGTSHLGEDLKL